jgi:hypothetical protein
MPHSAESELGAKRHSAELQLCAMWHRMEFQLSAMPHIVVFFDIARSQNKILSALTEAVQIKQRDSVLDSSSFA